MSFIDNPSCNKKQRAVNYPYDIYKYDLAVAPAYFRRDIANCSNNLQHFVAGDYKQVLPNGSQSNFNLHPLNKVYSTFGWGQFTNGYGQGIHPGKFNCQSNLCNPDPIQYASTMKRTDACCTPAVGRNIYNEPITSLSC